MLKLKRILTLVLSMTAFAMMLVLAQPGSSTLPIKVPAASMKARADLERNDFVSNYLVAPHDYPLGKVFQAALSFPTNSKLEAQLLARGGGVLKCKILGPKHAQFTNPGASSINLPLTALLQGQNIRIIVAIPKTVALDVQWDDSSVSIRPNSDLKVTFVDQPSPAGAPVGISSLQQIDSISASLTDLVLQSHAPAGGTGLRLDLDLTTSPNAANMLLPRTVVAWLWLKGSVSSWCVGLMR